MSESSGIIQLRELSKTTDDFRIMEKEEVDNIIENLMMNAIFSYGARETTLDVAMCLFNRDLLLFGESTVPKFVRFKDKNEIFKTRLKNRDEC